MTFFVQQQQPSYSLGGFTTYIAYNTYIYLYNADNTYKISQWDKHHQKSVVQNKICCCFF